METKMDEQRKERLAKNKIVINNWLEKKIYEIPYESFLRIKFSLFGQNDENLTVRENFIKDLACVYKNIYGRWPTIFKT